MNKRLRDADRILEETKAAHDREHKRIAELLGSLVESVAALEAEVSDLRTLVADHRLRIDGHADRINLLEQRNNALKPATAATPGGPMKRWVIVMSGVPERYFSPYDGFTPNPTWDTLYTWSDRSEAKDICVSLFAGDRRISVREAP